MKHQMQPGAWLSVGIASVLLLAVLEGCASSATVQPDGTIVRHYVGYVHIEVPQAEASQPVYVSDVSTIGIRVGNGLGIGFSRDKQVMVPLGCRLVVLVSTSKQLDDAVRKLSFFKDMPGFYVLSNVPIGEHGVKVSPDKTNAKLQATTGSVKIERAQEVVRKHWTLTVVAEKRGEP